MDQSAIKEICNNAVAAAKELNTACPATLIPSGMSVVDLEHLSEGRYRFRGKMKTSCLKDFIDYSNTESGQACFIDAENMSAVTFFNLGTRDNPGHGDHVASCKLKSTAAYDALRHIDGRELSQKDAAEWVEDWRIHITPMGSEDKELSVIHAISAIRNITIEAMHKSEHTDSDFGASRNTMDSIEASASKEIPVGLVFSCNPYSDLRQYDFYLRVSILTGGDKPKIKLRLVQHEEIKERMTNEFKELIGKGLDENVRRYIGDFDPR